MTEQNDRFDPFPKIFHSLPRHKGQFPATVLAAEQCRVFFSTLAAGSEIPPHTHDTDNYSIITQGELLLTMNGKTERIKQGQWCYVPKNERHSARTDKDTALIEVWFEES